MKWAEPVPSGRLWFEVGGCTAHLADCRDFSWPSACDVLIFDPPWDDRKSWSIDVPSFTACLAFCDGKYAGEAVKRFGPPRWVFVWDTMSTWSTHASQPLNGCKLCLLYGDAPWNRDAAIYGDPPPRKNHPSTAYEPASGRRLSDLYRKSLRWQSNGNASGASDRPPHTKPDEWVSALIGGVGAAGGVLCDPFMGGGSAIVGAIAAGMSAVATERDQGVFEWAMRRLTTTHAIDDSMPLFRGASK